MDTNADASAAQARESSSEAAQKLRSDLTPAESRLVQAAKAGEIAECGVGDDSVDAAKVGSWGEELRAEVIRRLLLGIDSEWPVHPSGVRIRGARIRGHLNLAHAQVKYPLGLLDCLMEEAPSLRNCTISHLELSGTHVAGFDATGLVVDHDVVLTGVICSGETVLDLARIKGMLNCEGGRFFNEGGTALSLKGIAVSGSLLLQNGFTAQGEVNLLGAQIGGQLHCDGGTFVHRSGWALFAVGTTVDGPIFLRNRFKAQGGVNLFRAQIGGHLNCEDGTFTSHDPNQAALVAERATVKGSVFLRNGFNAQGEVNLLSAQIGSLECDGGTFVHDKPDRPALMVARATVNGPVLLRNKFKAQGGVTFLDAQIGSLECDGGMFTSHDPNQAALVVERATVNGPVFLRNGFNAQGGVSLLGTKIGGPLNCAGGTFAHDKPDRPALMVARATVNGPVLLHNKFKAQGGVILFGAQIGDLLSCEDGTFTSHDPNQAALLAERATVKGSVFLRNGFNAQGEVNLRSAQIGSLECDGGTFAHDDPNRTALVVERATVNGPVFLRDGFSAQGEVKLLGARIGGPLDCGGGTFINPSGWAIHATHMKVNGPVLLNAGGEGDEGDRPVAFTAEGEVDLSEAQIDGELDCDGGVFKNGSDPERSALNAEGAVIRGPILLRWGFTAQGGVHLLGVQARTLECDDAMFTSHQDPALLAAEATITGSVFLRGSFTARGQVVLAGARIAGELNCRGATFVTPTGCGAERVFNGRSMKVDGSFIFSGLAERPQGIVDLTDAQVATLDDDAKGWPEPGNLRIRDFRYTALADKAPRTAAERTAWLHRTGADEFSPQPYEQLVKVLRESGYERDARDIAIQKQVDTRRWGRLSRIGWLGNWLLGLIGHGYKPGRAAMILVVLYLIGVTVFARAQADGVMVSTRDVPQPTTTTTTTTQQPTTTTQQPTTSAQQATTTTTTAPSTRPINARDPCPYRYPCFSPWAYSFDVLVPLVKLQQGDSWRPDASTSKGQWYRRFGYLMTIFGWALATLAAAGFSGLLRKD